MARLVEREHLEPLTDQEVDQVAIEAGVVIETVADDRTGARVRRGEALPDDPFPADLDGADFVTCPRCDTVERVVA
jgi:hypothetical protein